MKRSLCWLAAANLLLLAPSSYAATRPAEVEIPGIVADHTVSSVGHDFYRAFTDKWASTTRENLSINERPSARWGSWITITVNQDVMFQTFLFPIKRDFDKTVDAALQITQEAINKRQIDQSLLKTDDLAHDEF
ncbi:MAG TPA: curli production assembly/transport protein CsgE [Scandinavium sp.]|jgi:curli production assembly/transport component CsgE|uniref:curli production assembly/transport protein CsgE n=1 Tax=Scandinavium sp. TaxID=2830653 RepID=UPI002E31A912|nr:curli production assembly/transport protein CsgE [Scandinavium sp.]HEX4499924.1 curli production assembly/transport protein CsgE [Scandinavium sp.]